MKYAVLAALLSKSSAQQVATPVEDLDITVDQKWAEEMDKTMQSAG